jgi:hypothetical protein
MKTATLPPLRVEPELGTAADDVLEDGETLSSFVQQSIHAGVERRQAQREFIARSLTRRQAATRNQDCVPASKVPGRAERMLQKARRTAAAK